jgi:Carboxypeptidase regulatory-like domain/TonB dependent receptor
MRAFVLVFVYLACLAVYRADELAAVTGLVTDPHGRSVPGVTILITNINTDVASRTVTNDQGIYRVPSLQPGIYRMTVDKDGFKSIVKSGIELHVQDVASINFELQIGSVNETVTVEAGGLVINTTDATVSTVVDRNFAENLPLNGRSFQALIQLTPGVVLTASNSTDSGQFSINGQRAASNYWMIDGVSANIGVSSTVGAGNGFGGAIGGFSAQGGTNSLVSVDAMQEFRIQTSTYAPEFGRTPGGQISIVTRSGANQFHGSAFDYLRNDALDANNWFNTSVAPVLPKSQERQNDFGGTFSGPILRDRTFFFFSYEGLRLRLPQTSLTTAPDVAARQNAISSMQPFLNAYPLPNGPEDATNPGAAQFNRSYSNPATLDAYSIRIDQRLTDKLNLFGRFNYSPSETAFRGLGPLNMVFPTRITTLTTTLGATWAISPVIANDLRFNYSRTNAESHSYLDNFGGAVPLTSLPLPSPFTSQTGQFVFIISSLKQGTLLVGRNAQNVQRQINVVDNLSVQRGSHGLKLGVDYRRLSPSYDIYQYQQAAFFSDVSSAEAGNLFFSATQSNRNATFLFHNLGAFAQDTWRIMPRLTLTYGLRYDVDFAPSSTKGPSLPAVTGFNLRNLSTLALAPDGTPPFRTTYNNVAPRLGVAYQISQNPGWDLVVRGGFGVFFDLVASEGGNLFQPGYPFGANGFNFGGTFPLSPTASAPPVISAANLATGQDALLAFDPNLKLPYTLEWNVAIEQALGQQQSITASYIGSAGKRLLQTAIVTLPDNPNVLRAGLVSNTATSDYDALQLQFQRRLSHGLQVLASYTWSHSIDTGSGGSIGVASNTLVPTLNPNVNRGSSDFDIRNTFAAGTTYDIPAPKVNPFVNAILRGWSLQNVIQARSATPVNVYYSFIGTQFESLFNAFTLVRPDVIPQVPLYLMGAQYPGGRAINGAAFTPPPLDSNGDPLRQGNLGRNALRGFGATQWDFAVHREFPVHESVKLEFRAEMFNVLNHPNFAPPISDLTNPSQFGLSTQTLAQYLGGNPGGGGFTSLYQLGGPRSIQLALKLFF